MKKINSKTIPKNENIEGMGKKLFDADLTNKQANNNYNSPHSSKD